MSHVTQQTLRMEFIRALRSEDYKQVTGSLREDQGRDGCNVGGCYGYCAMGLATQVWNDLNPNSVQSEDDIWTDGDGEVVDVIAEDYGFHGCAGELDQRDRGWDYRTIIEMNDDHGKSFKEIADFIEEHPESVWSE